MIVVRVELHSAITGKVTEIARAAICNVGGTRQRGDYRCISFRGRDKESLDKMMPNRTGEVTNYPRLSIHVWHLVARALIAMGYAGKDEIVQSADHE